MHNCFPAQLLLKPEGALLHRALVCDVLELYPAMATFHTCMASCHTVLHPGWMGKQAVPLGFCLLTQMPSYFYLNGTISLLIVLYFNMYLHNTFSVYICMSVASLSVSISLCVCPLVRYLDRWEKSILASRCLWISQMTFPNLFNLGEFWSWGREKQPNWEDGDTLSIFQKGTKVGMT